MNGKAFMILNTSYLSQLSRNMAAKTLKNPYQHERSRSCKYRQVAGTHYDTNLTWNVHIENVAWKANKRSQYPELEGYGRPLRANNFFHLKQSLFF